MTSDIDIKHAEFSYSLRVNLRVRAGCKVQCHMWKIVAKVVGVTERLLSSLLTKLSK